MIISQKHDLEPEFFFFKNLHENEIKITLYVSFGVHYISKWTAVPEYLMS